MRFFLKVTQAIPVTGNRRRVILLVILLALLIGCAVETGTRVADATDPIIAESSNKAESERGGEEQQADRAVAPAISQNANGNTDQGASEQTDRNASKNTDQDASEQADQNANENTAQGANRNTAQLRRSLDRIIAPALAWSKNSIRIFRTRFGQTLNTLPQVSSMQQIVIIGSTIAFALLIAVVFSVILI